MFLVGFVFIMLATIILYHTRGLRSPSHILFDFDPFYIAARRVWLGDFHLIYQFKAFGKMLAEIDPTAFMPWTYPPQFALLLAPLAFLPSWAAYLLFIVATLAFYLLTLRTIAGNNFMQILLVLYPALALTIASGQNGFLTGTLIGLVCIHAEKRQALAGLALGAMVIKPHLAIAVSIYLLAKRRWMTIATAAMVVLVSSLLCTLVFGLQIWPAWLGAIRDSTRLLELGAYPLYRMISGYVVLYKVGLPAKGAFWGQAVVACLALVAMMLGVVRRISPSFSLGISTLVSVMISPYAYDYDLPIVGIGLALMLPDLARVASARERNIMYWLILVGGFYAMAQLDILEMRFGKDADPAQHFMPPVAGLAMMALLALILRIVLRKAQPDLASNFV